MNKQGRRYTDDFKIEVAIDFHFTGMTTRELAEKYKVSLPMPSAWGKQYPKAYLQSLGQEQETAIIVKSRDILAAKLAIEYFGIQIIKPDNIIIEQQYVSKL